MNAPNQRLPRMGCPVPNAILDRRAAADGMWYEAPEEVKRQLALAQRRAILLAWVRKQMAERLTGRERECIELHFFQAQTYESAGALTGTNRSSVFRGVQRALRKLRQARDEDDSWRVALEAGRAAPPRAQKG